MTYSPPPGTVNIITTPPAYTIRLDDVGGGVSYVGEADPGANPALPVWRIKKIVEVGDDITITWADGDDDFDNIWNNRLALVYS